MARPRGKRPDHGTRARYGRLRCRCVDCTAANAQYQREYRARTTPSTVTTETVRYRVGGVEVEQSPLW
jgi:hypothetical protein